ncbi:MAG: hypothetical protein HOB98_10960 [Gammaproteobacteria bacterium]|jgi:hypothetical protein|nr:hypothetical protein [Gammaproteobacteria bacterium]MBT3868108.1 hypothetical protein [Gammaproteobacteria bacterium]MBT4379626.1 hypothetical protein [Gammaproteobacteria bacterium]MBT4616954.1 hypothetical protein [Gammaproteobacteria bacterium]MBT5789415.1 hypothetical protein [Gammaproteobacteria bacterium]
MRIRLLLRIMSSEKTDVLRLGKKHLAKVKVEPTAVFAAAGSLVGNIIVTAAFTAPQLGTDTFSVLRNLTALTWRRSTRIDG